MASDPLAKLRDVLGVGPGVILSAEEIALALSRLPGPEANAVRAQLQPEPVNARKPNAFGGVPR